MRQLKTPDRIRFYNSERREVGGMYANVWSGATDQKYHLDPPTYIELLNLDGTGTDDTHRKEMTLFTYANGAHIDIQYYIVEHDNRFSLVMDTLLKNQYDNVVEILDHNASVDSSKQVSQSISNVHFYYTPTAILYPSLEFPKTGNHGGGAYLGGFIYGPRVTASPYERPAYNSAMTYEEWTQYYTQYGIMSCLNMATIDQYEEILIGAGDDTPITPILPSEDTSEPGGGDDANPDYDPYGDPVDFAGLPTGGSAIASGFVRVYTPTAQQLQDLAGELWGHDFVTTIQKIMNDPMEAMISLHSVPINLVGSGPSAIKIGNYTTQVNSNYLTAQYYTVNCGNISLPEHWASALDYSPYTNVDIFIPFVGVRPLQIDDVMNKVLTLKYNVDILTGSAVAMLKCGESVLYTYNTQIHSEIPYTMSSYGRLVQSIIGVAGTAIGATAGGAGAILGAGIGGALGTAMAKHSDISRGGALGGSVGVMGDFTPYLIIHRPLQSLASGFASKKGYPSNIGATLGSLSGYTVVDKIHLTDIDCTDTERDEIHALLKDGVII